MNYQQIRRIKIKGFKSIKECDLKLSNINLLIGSNGAGKSNFISVFKMLQNIIEKTLQRYIGISGGANALLFNGRKQTEYIEIEFTFGVNSYEFKLVPTDENTFIFDSEHFNYDGYWQHKSYVGGGYPESRWDAGVPNKINNYIKPILQNEKWRVYHFHDTSASARVKQTHKITNNIDLLFDAGNLAAFLYRLKFEHPVNYKQIVSTIRMIAPYFRDFVLEKNPLSDDIILRWQQIGSDDTFNANQLSDGTIRFICLTTLFLQPAELQPETIIVDEPELGLHPYAITLLAEIIKKAATKKQVIISTQSVDLLNEFSANDIIIVDRTENGTVFKRHTEEELQEWLSDDYAMGDLWKKNILGGRP
ncbi:MAG: AAA family ATPase [Clostridiales bacterium]|nr:AAA family ATPase [Clostridiales bacterium]